MQVHHHLNLAGWQTTKSVLTAKALEVAARYTVEVDACPCGSPVFRNGGRTLSVHDLSHEDRPVTITVRRQRYVCKGCGKGVDQPLPDLDDDLSMTRRARRAVEDRLLRMPTVAITEEFGIHGPTLRRIRAQLLDELERGRVVRTPHTLGIDEKMIAGAHRTTLVDLGSGSALVDILPDTRSVTLENRLTALSSPELVQVVVIDGRRVYRDTVRKCLPGATIVFDRWHAQCCVGNRYRFAQDQASYDAFAALWESPDRSTAAAAFAEWIAGLTAREHELFAPFLRLWAEWHREILAYFKYRVSNAGTEARNKQIAALTAQSSTFDFATIRGRALYGHIRPNMGLIRCDGCGARGPDGSMELADLAGEGGEIGYRLLCRACLPGSTRPRPGPE